MIEDNVATEYEKKFVKDIVAAIVDKKLGLNPQDDGEVIKIYFPPMTEERRKGIATFRVLSYGDTSHLYIHGEPPAFAARFCECYEDDTRHD